MIASKIDMAIRRIVGAFYNNQNLWLEDMFYLQDNKLVNIKEKEDNIKKITLPIEVIMRTGISPNEFVCLFNKELKLLKSVCEIIEEQCFFARKYEDKHKGNIYKDGDGFFR